jgi:RNA polymerase sigma-70 factor (sigma-E family)
LLLAPPLPGPAGLAGFARRIVALLSADLVDPGGRGAAAAKGPAATGEEAWPEPLTASPSGPADFAAFYQAERRRVVAVVASLTGDRAAAEDIVQEAFATALRKWSSIRGYDRPGDWVKRVAVNRAISRFRRRTVEEKALRKVASARDPLDRQHDREDPLWTAVRALPGRQAQVISLMYIDDLTIERTADVLGISTGAVKSHLHRAKGTLATALRPEGTT